MSSPINGIHFPSRDHPFFVCLSACLLFGLTAGCFPSKQVEPVSDSRTKGSNSSQSTAGEPDGLATHHGMPRPDLPVPDGMVWIPGGQFLMGSNDLEARDNEKPVHIVQVAGFYADVTEVTNAQFREFVEATGYVTIAEIKPSWEEISAQLPPGTPTPPDEALTPGSLVFQMTEQPVRTDGPDAIRQWWHWTPGADWRHPQGPDSNIQGLDDHPVVHVAWDDAVAFCKWAGKRLPTEAEWEFAARGGWSQKPYVWGDEKVSDTHPQANIWQGNFPNRNLLTDGYLRTAPVKSFAPNPYGLYDVAGNVWEWCQDWFRNDTYPMRAERMVLNPTGPPSTDHPYEPRRVQRGGSFLCHRDYCSSYRPAARMSTAQDSGLSHVGFRCVMTQQMWRDKLAADPPNSNAKGDMSRN